MTNWELIIVDDCSTDGSYEAALEWAVDDARIHVHRSAESSGECASRNLALRRSRGEFVSYLDCDDEYYPHYLASVVPFFRRCDVVVCGYDIFIEGSSTDEPAGSWDPARRRGSPFGENINSERTVNRAPSSAFPISLVRTQIVDLPAGGGIGCEPAVGQQAVECFG